MYQGQKDAFTGFVLQVFIRLESAQTASSGAHIASSQGGKERKGHFINNFNIRIRKARFFMRF